MIEREKEKLTNEDRQLNGRDMGKQQTLPLTNYNDQVESSQVNIPFRLFITRSTMCKILCINYTRKEGVDSTAKDIHQQSDNKTRGEKKSYFAYYNR